ncbi:MAG: hypothetical protein Q8P24_05935 [Desulfobacterales bacterium]|nr:hypothetical protein [Desulfobacterales bacterium]
MKQSGGKYFIVVILAISVAATLMGHVNADAQWEAEWQKVLEAAKKEGKVLVYAQSFASALRKQVPIFKKRFGIDLDVTTGSGSDISRKLLAEKTAGMNLVDVVNAGGDPMFVVKQLGVTEPMDNKR